MAKQRNCRPENESDFKSTYYFDNERGENIKLIFEKIDSMWWERDGLQYDYMIFELSLGYYYP